MVNMEISGSRRSYNSYGGSCIYTFVGSLLTSRLDNYGSAVESVELIACLRSRTREFLPTLEELFNRFHEYVKQLPQVTFRRQLKRIEVNFLSERFFAEDDAEWKPSAEKCNTAADEVAEVLPLLRKRIKPTDDFDTERFLSDASRLLSTKIDSMEDWERLREEAKAKRLAARAKKSPWELLEIDWRHYHPKAREVLDDPFFWECADDLAPNGNDTGADLLEDYRKWDKRNHARSPLDFLDWLMAKWGVEPIDWNVTDEETVHRLNKSDSTSLGLCNETSIALAFAVVKMRAKCPSDVIRMALAGLIRTAILVKASALSDEIKASWDEAIAKMKGKLESLLHRAPW
jgi:uncharacterized protein YfeS